MNFILFVNLLIFVNKYMTKQVIKICIFMLKSHSLLKLMIHLNRKEISFLHIQPIFKIVVNRIMLFVVQVLKSSIFKFLTLYRKSSVTSFLTLLSYSGIRIIHWIKMWFIEKKTLCTDYTLICILFSNGSEFSLFHWIFYKAITLRIIIKFLKNLISFL
jgi:hypothetical protein